MNNQCSIATYLAVKAMASLMRFLYTECVLVERRRSAKGDVAEKTVVVPWKNTASLWNITYGDHWSWHCAIVAEDYIIVWRCGMILNAI